MFWREQKAAIAGFHPLHQALIHERGFAATLPAADWSALITSLYRHAGLVRRRKWQLPARTLDVVVPLILEVSSDLGPSGTLAVTADLRGRDAPGKSSRPRDLPVRKPVRSASETWLIDPWLRMRADLRDGSVLEILVVDRERRRRITKRNPRGKYKTKTKSRTVQIIKVRRKLPREAPSRVPATAAPGWVRVLVREGSRRSVIASAKLLRMPQNGQQQVDLILSVATEPFRWTPENRGVA
ncbi:hypothetical protein [Actinoplanes siamensis]|uniref:Uncharacterized protein n=1 Tax=Actinoplanes siamensis TaxID=1223317 RepID=A0A919N6G9_9ACTN|nr:hypothetical protein [Actinoplanes siamensis]GIF05237.1 hypothetical protein Asi03nite_27750 [Actinoplanes siamensis]